MPADNRMPPGRRPPIGAVVKTDFLALVGAIAPAIATAIAIGAVAGMLPDKGGSIAARELRLIPAQPLEIGAAFAAACGVAAAALLVWRVRKIRVSFATGHRVEGTITRLRPFKDRAYVGYAYRLGGVMHEVSHLVHQTATYRALVEGQTVSIAVDPLRPRSGFVVELFER